MSSSVAPSSALCTIDSIKLGTKELSKERSQNFLVARIEAFVQTEIFKKAVENNPGKYRLRLENDAIVLEKQNGETWEIKDLTSPAPEATGTTTTVSQSAPTQENPELKTFTAAFRHFENAARFQENLRSAYKDNSCWLDSGLSLVRNIPSLYKKFLSDKALPQQLPKSDKLKQLRNVQNGPEIGEALGIAKIQQDDPINFFAKLGLGDEGKRLATVTTEIKAKDASEKLDKKGVDDLRNNLAQYQGKSSKESDVAQRSSLSEALDPKDSTVKLSAQSPRNLEALLQHYQAPSDVSLTALQGSPSYTITRTIDYSQPLLIELKSESMDPGSERRVKKEDIKMEAVPDILENQDQKLHLNGFLVHTGKADGGHWVAYFRKLGLDGSYKWYKDDDLTSLIQEVNQKDSEAAKKTATYLYYDPDNYVNSDQVQSSRSRSSSISSNSSFYSVYSDS